MGMDGGPRGAAWGFDARLDEAIHGLRRRQPHLSAATPPSLMAICDGLCLAIALTAAALAFPGVAFSAAHWIGWCLFAALAVLRVIAAAVSLWPRPASMAPLDTQPALYTLICPMYREPDQVEPLIAALGRLDYPKSAVQVILALEQDDDATIAAAAAVDRRGLLVEIALTPASAPRTKPKALNYAFAQARGEFIVIYDAEDRPDPRQLRAAIAAFAAGGERLGVVQAPLAVDNAGASWIARQFAAEYAIQFGQTLPLLARLGLPFPLGGTSNHFRRTAMLDADGWDPFNVTEDADLGYRLARRGWMSAMIAPPTWEEAPVAFGAWLRQRTRWIKGHMQTWLVLMRAPRTLISQLGPGGFLAMQAMLGAGLIAAFLHGPLAVALLVAALAPDWTLAAADWALAGLGYASAAASGLLAALITRDGRLAQAALSMPLYWPLASLAALWALVELVIAPSYWAKTAHGQCPREPAKD